MKKQLLLLLALLLASACTAGDAGSADEPVTIRLMTHDSFDISQETMEAFRAETGIQVEVLKAGDAGEMLNKAILARESPLADVLYGVDNTFLSRALQNEIFLAYDSPRLDELRDELKLDPLNRALPVDFGDVCLNFDIAWFAQRNLAPPQNLADLVNPAYADLTVVANPATSSPGLAFLMATIDSFGEDGYLDYWQGLVENGVMVVSGWNEAYYGAFTAASDGDRPIVVSYASSPAAEVFFAETPPAAAPTAAVVADKSCFRQIEFAGILSGTPHQEAAAKLVDFMLSRRFQEDIPLHMFVFPANEKAQLPQVFVDFSTVPSQPASIDPDTIEAGRDSWISAWTATVLR